MVPKIAISEAKKARIIDKAGHFGVGLGAKYGGCAPITFAAICEAFKSEGIELFSHETQETIIQGMLGLHGGVAMTGIGTCGAITSSAFAISCVIGVTTEDLEKNPTLNSVPAVTVVEDIMDRFEETYGATDCLRLRYNRVQRTFDFLDPDATVWEVIFAASQPNKCGMFANCYKCGSDQVMPAVGAMWAAESICDLLNKKPEDRKKLPPHLQGYNFQDLIPKAQKVAAFLKELGIGQPEQKISWREYRKFKLAGKKGLEESRPCGVDAPGKKRSKK
jgi:hypothetical protein